MNGVIAGFLHQTIGKRNTPLSCVICESYNFPDVAPLMIREKSYYEDHGFFRRIKLREPPILNLISRGGIKATKKSYYALINPYMKKKKKKKKNGRDTFITLVAKYAGENKLQKLLEDSAEILQNQCWSIQGMFMLYRFISFHHIWYVMMTQCAKNMYYQNPKQLTCVSFLINAIE